MKLYYKELVTLLIVYCVQYTGELFVSNAWKAYMYI
jgi:hypothetical protein